jgi:hypothetical protein
VARWDTGGKRRTGREPPGFCGYSGTYTELTTGYTSCLDISGASCGPIDLPGNTNYRCNPISGELTLASAGKWVTLQIGTRWWFPPHARFNAGICLNVADPRIHDVYLWGLAGAPPSWPCATEGISGGYGPLVGADAQLEGTSRPLGHGVYADSFTLRAQLYPVLR